MELDFHCGSKSFLFHLAPSSGTGRKGESGRRRKKHKC
jgi:hypothetical protein